MQNLEQIIEACKKQHILAQKELYQLFKEDLYVLCLKYCRNKEEAQDTLHDVFIEIFKHIKRYKGKGTFEGWIKRITINKAIDSYKRKREFANDYEAHISEEEDSEFEELTSIPLVELLAIIQELPNQYRLVFNLYELDDYSHKEIAELLNISISTSKSNLHRSKQLLRSKLTEFFNQQKELQQ